VGVVEHAGSSDCTSYGKGTCDSEAESNCTGNSQEFVLNRVIGQSKRVLCIDPSLLNK